MAESSSDSEIEARRYARMRYRLLVLDLAILFLFLGFAQFSGFSRQLSRWWSGHIESDALSLLGYLVVLGAAYYVILLPLRFYRGYRLEHRFGLSRLSLAGWVRRQAKELAVSAIISLLLIEALYAILRTTGSYWPLWAALGWVAFSVVLAKVFPTILLPIFYKTTPLRDEVLVKRLLSLCERVGLSALGVFRFDLGVETRKANAALAGLGNTRRVLLADTLLSEFPPDEIEGVLAHELAHLRCHHIRKMLIINAVGAWIAFILTDFIGKRWVEALGLTGLSDISGFPVLALWLSALSLFSLPLQNGLSRFFEWQADRLAVQMTQPKSFARALRRLACLNLADPNPPKWIEFIFFDHPPIAKRIQSAEEALVA